MSEIEKVIARHRELLFANDAATMQELARQWVPVRASLQEQMEILAEELLQTKKPTLNQLYRMERYKALLVQVEAQIKAFSSSATATITIQQANAVTLAMQQSGELLHVLGVDVFSTAAGYSAVGTPLAKLLQADFATAATALTQQLLNGAALGYGAKKIALNMTNAVTNISLDRALTISRTEIMRAYNSTSLENYKASGVVSQWKRVESKSPRTCLACIIADGTLYPTSTSWYDHPRGRGTLVPVVDGMPPPEIEPARVWFEKQSESTQQKIMGKGHYDAWVRGVELDRMVTVKDNETWGKSLSITPLGALK